MLHVRRLYNWKNGQINAPAPESRLIQQANHFVAHLFLLHLLTGEAMEQGLRDCCRSIRIGKILIQSDEETQKAKVYYAKFPPDVYRRKVLLMYPILSK